MSELLVLNFDGLCSPTINFNTNENKNTRPFGWGLGWYPNDDYAASVVKETSSNELTDLTSVLSDWRRFRSTTFFHKIKGPDEKRSQENTQPFQRSFAGRDWLFLHNGYLNLEKLKNLLGPEHTKGFLAPMGSTDSELIFCYLLQQIQKQGAIRIADVPWEKFAQWFEDFDVLGTADIAFTDGQNTIAFHGKNSDRQLYYLRRIPPYGEINKVSCDSMDIDFSDPLDTHRSCFMISSSQFDGGAWNKMMPGQFLVIRRDSIIYDSLEGRVTSPKKSVQQKSLSPDKTLQKQSQEQSQNSSCVTNVRSMIVNQAGAPLQYRQYKITHMTRYTYAKEVERSTHILRLQPVEDKIQEVIRSTLFFSVDGEKLYYEDVFGNQAIHITVEKPYTQLEIKTESEIKIYAALPDDLDCAKRKNSIPLVWMPWQRQMMLPYLLPPELPETQLLELSDFALSFVEKGDYDLMETLKIMNRQIYKDFQYVSGSTTNQTTPFEVFASRRGVCQDFANLFICLARLLNIPARYRAGYIYTGANYQNKVQSEASHAWVEVYFPYLGWRGFDPTNGCIVSQEHIRVACGRNYRDATPTTGTIFKGGGREMLQASVKVENI